MLIDVRYVLCIGVVLYILGQQTDSHSNAIVFVYQIRIDWCMKASMVEQLARLFGKNAMGKDALM